MKEKTERYTAIKRIVAGSDITGQEELLELLIKEGFEVTQATLSRDLKALGIGKVLGKNGGYLYSLPDPEQLATFHERLAADIMRGFVSLDFSGSLGVIKTHPGHAGPVAFALDNSGIDEIIGTVAGDDTIIVVPADAIGRDRVRKVLIEKIPQLKEKL